ncbi:maleylpyruvate isomerase family mycothiol-dependent enzyme [Janibacter indicus]|nr:maleylpyruvate isomerase family mycothiol-dependent enzyme [Janibacter indicus]
MDRTRLWALIHEERAAMAATLESLTPEEWEHPSLCAGWSVKDVAAHVISNPQIGWAQLPGMLGRNLGRGYNSMIRREVQRLGATRTPEQVLADFATYADSTRHVPVTTAVEPLVDALVHHQDVLHPLGRSHDPDPEAAAVAADRCRLLSSLLGGWRLVRGVHMVATDVDWVRGDGPELTGPVLELLMVCAGRARAAHGLTGEGTALLPSG